MCLLLYSFIVSPPQAYYAAKRGASRKLAGHTLTDLSNVEASFSTDQTNSLPSSQPLLNTQTKEQSGIQKTLTDGGQSGVDEMGPWTSASDLELN